jgi:hypothetical protein
LLEFTSVNGLLIRHLGLQIFNQLPELDSENKLLDVEVLDENLLINADQNISGHFILLQNLNETVRLKHVISDPLTDGVSAPVDWTFEQS